MAVSRSKRLPTTELFNDSPDPEFPEETRPSRVPFSPRYWELGPPITKQPSMEEKRSLKNIKLTKKYHWTYMIYWVLLNSLLLVMTEVVFLLCIQQEVIPQPDFLPMGLGLFSVIVFLGMLICIQLIGRIWAHRLAGVHIRTERTLKEAAQDFSVRLRYRRTDRLEEVAEAFNEMMECLENPVVEASADAPNEKKAKPRTGAGNRRSLRNLDQTSKHHIHYMSLWLSLTCGNLLTNYLAANLYVFLITVRGQDIDLHNAVTLLTALLLFAVIGVMFGAAVTAHRLAGVHVKLARTFERVAAGERDVELRFREYDKLTPLEEAFAEFMNAVRAKSSKS